MNNNTKVKTILMDDLIENPPRDIISKVLHYLGKNMPDALAVQIGAMDGINFDDTRGFFDLYKWKSILVEPIPEIFEELKKNLSDRENLIYENSAIGDTEGTVKMLTIPKSVIEQNDLHLGYKGMSAIYPLRNGFGSSYQRDIDVKNNFGVDIEVPCITFDQLIEKHSFSDVNILVCDAEGYDWNIFKSIDLKKYNLKFIRLEWINLSDEEKQQLIQKLEEADYIIEVGTNIDAVHKEIFESAYNVSIVSDISSHTLARATSSKQNYTIVSGLWNLQRDGRDFETHYLPRFREFLKIDAPMILFLPEEIHNVVWEIRNSSNTFVKSFELSDVKRMYDPHWEKTQELRTSEKWLNLTGPGGWLKTSPQASLEFYNPIVQSKMFLLHDASIYNTFNTDYFYWIDAGITNTVPVSHLVQDRCLDNIVKHTDPFLFLSYPYESAGEIHGFELQAMNRYAGEEVKFVCRGGLFGGHKTQITQANATYYSLLSDSLNSGYMGTEESIFTLMSYSEPHLYRRYALDGNGLIVKFTDALIKDSIKLEELKKPIPKNVSSNVIDINNLKTNLYILTFNFPEQLLHTLETMKKVPEWLRKPNLYLIDNSTNEEARNRYKQIAEDHEFEYHSLEGNKGICGGRQYAAEHFHNSEADYYFFFEDDMTSNPPETKGEFCRNGFRKFIPNLYDTLHYIMKKENFDYLKLSFTEVYWDNDIQTSWYNVPQSVRTQYWPDYDKLPVTGRDPNAPRTEFNTIGNVRGLSYISGDVTYTNWPMIMSKKGNQKVFIDTKWANPFEQTWMSHVFQMQKKGEINAAVLLASPIWHDRIKHYKPEERREN